MIYRQYGRTEKYVSVLGFGGSRFKLTEAMTPTGQEKYSDLIISAYHSGINYFDTAPDYCGKQSEHIFGMAFSALQRQGHNNFFIATKTRLASDPTADAVRRRLESSLTALQMEKIHFYHMWGILSFEQYKKVVAKGGPYWGALKAKEEGLIDHICFSTHCTGEEIEKIIKDGYFEGVTLGYNILNFKYREKGLEAARRHGLGVAVMNPLNGGVIPKNASLLKFISTEKESVVQTSLRFVASNDAVSTVLSGMITFKELDENVLTFKNITSLQTSHIKYIENNVAIALNSLCTGCNYCSGCPQGIDIYKPLLSYNNFILSENDIYNFFDDLKISWGFPYKYTFNCIECGLCEEKCTQHLPIRKILKEINALIDSLPANKKEAVDSVFSKPHRGTLGIYAIGNDARDILKDYEAFYGVPDFPLYLFDSDSKKWGLEPFYPGTPVRSPQEIESLKIDRLLIASRNFFDEIAENLSHLRKKGVTFIKYKHFSS